MGNGDKFLRFWSTCRLAHFKADIVVPTTRGPPYHPVHLYMLSLRKLRQSRDDHEKISSHPSLLHLPGSFVHPVLGPFNGRALRRQHQTQPCQFGFVSLQVDLGVCLQPVQGPRAALIQEHQGAQHRVEAEVHVRSQQVVQQSVDPFSVCGAADKAADFGPQAGRCARRPFNVVIATGAKGQHALEGLIGPQ